MHILFNLDYRTTYGETLALNVKQDDATVTYLMSTVDGELRSLE